MAMPLVAMGLWIVVQALTVVGVANYLRHLPSDARMQAPGGVVLILSVTDDWSDPSGLIERLHQQKAVLFRLILATSGACPAATALASQEPNWITCVAAGVADGEGQKVHKLRAALASLRPDDAYLLFIDADIQPGIRFVGRMMFALAKDKADITTGYRMLLPAPGRPFLALLGAVEMQLATLPRFPRATMPWGGAMGMRRDVVDRLDLDAVLAGRLSDDMAIGLAAWRAGLRLRPVRDMLVATPLDDGVTDALAFGVRQYRHIVTNSAGMWGLATLVVLIQSAGWLWAIGWGGGIAILIGYGAALGRVLLRRPIIAAVLEAGQAGAARRSLWWDGIAPFAVTWAHLLIQIAALLSRRIRWGGYDYWLKRGKVARMRRVDQKPAGN